MIINFEKAERIYGGMDDYIKSEMLQYVNFISPKNIEEIVGKSQMKINDLVEQNQIRVGEGKLASKNGMNVFTEIKILMNGISSRSENIRISTTEQISSIEQSNIKTNEIRNIYKKNIGDTNIILK